MKRIMGVLCTTVILVMLSSPAVAGQDWAGIKAWTGTIKTVRNTLNEKKVFLTKQIYRVVRTRENESLKCNARFVNRYRDQQYLTWEGGKFPTSISLDDFRKSTTYKNDKVDISEEVSEKGSGTSETEEMETVFGIDLDQGTYAFTISPVKTIAVLHSEKFKDSLGRTIREAHDTVPAEHTGAVTVENQPLPASGMVISGEATIQGGTLVKWTLSPVR